MKRTDILTVYRFRNSLGIGRSEASNTRVECNSLNTLAGVLDLFDELESSEKTAV